MEFLEIVSSLLTLIILEIVLGIDNLVFLSILTDKLPYIKRKKARQWGLTLAWVVRLFLLIIAIKLIHLTKPLIVLGDFSFSIRSLFLLAGGLFLIAKATQEIHDEVGSRLKTQPGMSKKVVSFKSVVVQVVLMDTVFSLDSVLTAVGLTKRFWVMAIAITCAILVMMYSSKFVSQFIDKYYSIKILALSFLMLIGMVLVADAFSFYVPRGYIYFAMGFSLGVEILNLKTRYK